MRTPESCNYRKSVSDDDGSAICDLVRTLVGGKGQSDIGQVQHDACQACCRSQPEPNDRDLNPVLASLLFSEAERLQQLPDCGGCSRTKVDSALERAQTSIPMLLPSESESAPVACDNLAVDIGVKDIERIVPLPAQRDACKPEISWAVGVTTSPRRQPTLETCIDTLESAGWPSPHLFVDGKISISTSLRHLPQTHRDPQLGAWLNYYQSLQEQLRHSQSDVYMLVQDDTAFPPTTALRTYLDHVVNQLGPEQLISLYCPQDYDAETPGWDAWDSVWHFGALAFVWSRMLAEAFVADPIVAAYELPSDGKQKAGIDVVIGEWANRAGVSVYRSTPSMVQHIGHVSSIWATSRAVGLRRATSYVGDLLARH